MERTQDFSWQIPSEAIINLDDKEKSVDETNIRIRPRKRKEMGLTYIVICIDLLRFALIVILFWLSRLVAQYMANAQQNVFG